MLIPCKDCLVYAACKHKRIIVCDLLANWKDGGLSMIQRQAVISNILPKWIKIRGENQGEEKQ